MKAIYTRISEDDSNDRLGVERQRQDCLDLAARHHWDPSTLTYYEDDDRSAYTGRPRPAYLQLLTDVATGTIDGIIGYNFDRLWRLPKELEAFLELAHQHHLTHVHTVEGDVDLSTHSGQFQARILVAVAKKSSDDTSRRIKRKHKELIEQGRPTGPIGYGYHQDLTVNEDEALVIKDAAARILAGHSLNAVTQYLNARAIPSPRGKSWSRYGLRYLLTSGRIAGLREQRGPSPHTRLLLGTAAWPAIISEDDLTLLRSILLSERRLPAPRTYLLNGLLTCGLCGARLGTGCKTGHVRRYRCRSDQGGCNRLGIDASKAEALVSELVLQRLGNVKPRRQDLGLSRKVQADEKRLAVLAQRRFVDESITDLEYEAAREPILFRLEANRNKLHVGSQPAIPTDVRAQWPSLTFDQQRTIFTRVIDVIPVAPALPGRRFDPARLGQVRWKV